MKKYKFCIYVLAFLFVACNQISKDSSNKADNDNNQDYHGIDVSNHQGDIDWSLVCKDRNIQFVYIKATEGATHIDKNIARILKEQKIMVF